MYTGRSVVTVCTLCTLFVPHFDRFEGPTEASSLILIFPLFEGSQWPAGAGHHFGNRGRLGPPESQLLAVTAFPELCSGKDEFLNRKGNAAFYTDFLTRK